MTLKTFLVTTHLVPSLTAVGLLVFLIRYKAKQDYIKLLGLLLFASIIAAAGQFFLFAIKITPNYASTIYHILELPLLATIYYRATKRTIPKTSVIVISGVYVVLGFWNLLFIQKQNINSYTLVVESIIIIFYSLYYFYWLIEKLPTTQLHRLPMFWLNSAWIFFFSGNLFFFVFISYLVNVEKNDLLVYWTLHNILKSLEIAMIIGALWIDLRNIKSPS
jgi:hypothetical protein